MNRETISLAQTSAFSSLIVDYINNESKLAAFYKYPFNISSFKQAIADKANEFIDRKLLVEVLKEQYSAQNINVESLHIDRLENPATFTVCTGHQLCLFTGPLYFIYKLITVINLSEELKKNYPAYNFVPAYWMASEDHDFEEINHIHLFGKKIEWNAEQAIGDERRIAGAIETKSILTLINELKPILGETLNAKELITLFEQAYLTNKNLADATRALVHSLFGKYGLLVIDANDHRFKKQITGIIKDDVLNNSNYKII
ncbi:MAG: bacillithiol biosynthesis BshC, partial [Bacteroidia bacterium]|nr:bacillithiol biosynthesis BshC [Bacteroidia bacterium]